MAAVMGKKLGSLYWYKETKKTIVGSSYLVLSVLFVYSGMIHVFYPGLNDEYYYILAAIVISALVEGLTK